MNAPYFIETLARNGDVLHRHQVDALPIRFGRGYDNDFILDDAFAAPRHAVLEAGEDGQAVLRDLGTKNGVVHLGKRKTSLVMTGDTVIRIGHTSLRVRGADFPVGPEMVDRTMHGWEGAIPGIVGMLLIGAFALITTWLSDTQAFQLIRYLLPLAFGIGAGLVWGGAWAFANRLFGRHARLGRHLFIVGCGLAAVLAYKLVASSIAYAFSLEALTAYSAHVAIAIAAGVIFFHLGTVKPHQSRRFTLACLIMAMIGSGLVLISNQLRYGRVADELFMSVLMPPSTRISPDHSVDEFMSDVGAMKARLDAQRAKKIKGDGADDED
ncbi:FHA domain-containing protein [Massilia atriviolacea]|uniref:FHA domain-containing protein n=1 Tax=Massilia atriviolacea TaxID=2495579 RepID=A0A430HK51_9BURK|nr:FHA domain-containing protein [Massilia atriviolacea]RSZ57908.1 FHA domain-containing protein [Massilia atriviolacea]